MKTATFGHLGTRVKKGPLLCRLNRQPRTRQSPYWVYQEKSLGVIIQLNTSDATFPVAATPPTKLLRYSSEWQLLLESGTQWIQSKTATWLITLLWQSNFQNTEHQGMLNTWHWHEHWLFFSRALGATRLKKLQFFRGRYGGQAPLDRPQLSVRPCRRNFYFQSQVVNKAP